MDIQAILATATPTLDFVAPTDEYGRQGTFSILIAGLPAGQSVALARQIIERRAGIMTAEFMGFVPNHVFMVRPELALSDEIVVDGESVSVPRLHAGNWYSTDNPEFL